MILFDQFKPFFGVIEGIDDPSEKCGKVQVRVYGYHTDNKKLLPTSLLKWFNTVSNGYASKNQVGRTHRYKIGSLVFGYFIDSDLQEGIVIGSIDSFENNESSVSRIARNESIDETLIQTKKDNVVSSITNAKGSNWSEPETQYNTEYPLNDVTQSESGHVIEIDDTPNAERISINHRTGSFTEYHPNGDQVDKIIGDQFEICMKSKKIYVNGDWDLVVNGNCYTNVSGENYVKCSTNTFEGNMKVTGDVEIDGNTNINKSLVVQETSTASDHLSDGISGKLHKHIGNLGLPTSPPIV